MQKAPDRDQLARAGHGLGGEVRARADAEEVNVGEVRLSSSSGSERVSISTLVYPAAFKVRSAEGWTPSSRRNFQFFFLNDVALMSLRWSRVSRIGGIARGWRR